MELVAPNVEMGGNCAIQEQVLLGLQYRPGCKGVRTGNNIIIRAFTVIYCDVVMGDDIKTGHHVVIREHTNIGSKVIIGTGSIIDGHVTIGDRVKIESNVYIPPYTRIGSDVFIGPNVVMTNDKYPQRVRNQYEPKGPVIEDGVSLGANVTIMPGISIGEGAFIAAGSVVTADVPKWTMLRGPAARIYPLPEKLKERNRAKQW